MKTTSITIHLGKAGWVKLEITFDEDHLSENGRAFVADLLALMGGQISRQSEDLRAR